MGNENVSLIARLSVGWKVLRELDLESMSWKLFFSLYHNHDQPTVPFLMSYHQHLLNQAEISHLRPRLDIAPI